MDNLPVQPFMFMLTDQDCEKLIQATHGASDGQGEAIHERYYGSKA